jgi:hypothetical protein
MQMSFINPAKSIVIGDDSGIGGDCLLFGHTSWLSHFEGYPVEFEPIEIGRSVSIAWRVFLLPGTKIGDGAVIGANSLVHRTIPPRCLAVGFPARVVSKAPDFPKELNDQDKVSILNKIVKDMIGYFNGYGILCDSQNSHEIAITTFRKTLWGKKNVSWKLRILTDRLSESDADFSSYSCDALVSLWEIPDPARTILNKNSIFWIDIESKERTSAENDLGEEVVQFLKRYGVRLYRVD